MLRRKGFTLIELLVVISIIALLIGILLPALGAARRTARQMANSTQLRGIQQGMVTFAQSNKKGGNDGFFPGLNSSGRFIEEETVDSANGVYGGTFAEHSNTMAIMLNANAFTPEYIINPADSAATEANLDDDTTALIGDATVANQKFSYGFLEIVDDSSLPTAPTGTATASDDSAHGARGAEWKETLNTAAVIAGDRNTGVGDETTDTTSGSGISSVWTEESEGDWRGTIVKNDNSTSFETSALFEQTKYGNATANTEDELFLEEATSATDPFATEFGNALIVRLNGEYTEQ